MGFNNDIFVNDIKDLNRIVKIKTSKKSME